MDTIAEVSEDVSDVEEAFKDFDFAGKEHASNGRNANTAVDHAEA